MYEAEAINSIRPALTVLVPLLAAVLVVFTGEKRHNLREFWSFAAGIVAFMIALSMVPTILGGKVVELSVFEFVPNVFFKFRVDALGSVFGLVATLLWIPTTIYNIGYMRGHHEKNQTRYFFFFTLAVASAVGVAYAGNLLTMLIFYEILTITAFPLVSHSETDEALRSARKYLLYLLPGGAAALGGIVITYGLAGTLDFGHNGILTGAASPTTLKLLFLMFIVGFGIKAAMMPFHSWLPAAMVAPTPVSALLHAVAVVNAGVFTVVRVVLDVFGVDLLGELGVWIYLCYAASFTIIVASLYAIKSTNLKRMLAFSTVSQLSYMILGVALLTPGGITGGIIHIAHQGFMKITLFYCAGTIFVHTGKKEIAELKGIGRRMPLTMGAFTIGAIGMIGIPPTAGFITKWFLVTGAFEASQVIFVIVLLISSLLNAGYYIPPIYNAFFGEPEGDDPKGYDEAPFALVAPLVFTAIASIILGVFPHMQGGFFANAIEASKHFVGG